MKSAKPKSIKRVLRLAAKQVKDRLSISPETIAKVLPPTGHSYDFGISARCRRLVRHNRMVALGIAGSKI